MFACAQTQLSIQISEYLYHYLQYDVSDMKLSKMMQQAVAKLVENSQGIVTSLSTPNITSLAHITGTYVGSAATKAAARTLIAEGAETAAETVSAAGYSAAVRTIVTGGTAALGVSVIIEAPFLASGIYKTYRKKKFEQISSEEAKREYTKQACMSAGVVVGATVGATAGTFIPVPIVGTFVGTLAGTTVGTGAGKLVGFLLSRLIKDGIVPDCAIIIPHSFEDFPDHEPE